MGLAVQNLFQILESSDSGAFNDLVKLRNETFERMPFFPLKPVPPQSAVRVGFECTFFSSNPTFSGDFEENNFNDRNLFYAVFPWLIKNTMSLFHFLGTSTHPALRQVTFQRCPKWQFLTEVHKKLVIRS